MDFLKRDRRLSISDQLDILRDTRIEIGQRISGCKEAIRRLRQYMNTPPALVEQGVVGSSSGQIFELSKEEKTYLKLPLSDPRKQAVLQKMGNQASQTGDDLQNMARARYEEQRREYDRRLPHIPEELTQLEAKLVELKEEYRQNQTQIDRLRDGS